MPTAPTGASTAAVAPLIATNPYAALGVAGLDALGSVTGGGTPGIAKGELSDRSPIHIAPVGVNLGAILAPFNEGSPENGGYGINTLSRYMPERMQSEFQLAATGTTQKGNYLIYIVGAGALALAVLLFRKK